MCLGGQKKSWRAYVLGPNGVLLVWALCVALRWGPQLVRSPDSPWLPQSKFSVVTKDSETAVSVAEDPSKVSILQTKNEMYHLFPEAPLSPGKKTHDQI